MTKDNPVIEAAKSASTYWRLGERLNQVLSEMPADHKPSIEYCEKLLLMLAELVPIDNEDGIPRQTVEHSFRAGIKGIKSIASSDEQNGELLRATTTMIACGVAIIVQQTVLSGLQKDKYKIPNLAQVKAAPAKAAAIEHARELWGNDTDHELLISEVEGLIKTTLETDGFGGYTLKTIRKWLNKESGLVPEYANKPGRPKKTK